MCGIAGIVDLAGQPIDPVLVRRMMAALEHRGPDDEGFYDGGADGTTVERSPSRRASLSLGHRRLSIIDLSPAGRQPLSNDEKSVWITYNGEIYNFQTLRAELEGLGRRFRTRTDTEVIVHAYEQWGVDCVKRLRGMFAFGIWDERQHRLFLARDRVGKKPLFYGQFDGRFFFASELQAVVACPRVPREVNPDAIDSYLSWGYVPAPHTAFRGIFKLPPAHWLTLDLTPRGPTQRVQRYWTLNYLPKSSLTAVEAAQALREKLTEAVRLRLISDVPLGAFLSGGIDSSIVVGLMASLSGAPVKTFSIGFEEAAYNELDHARRIAELWATAHQEFVVRPDALAILPKLVRHYGEPYADSSAIATFCVAQMTRASVTVALNGDGGDESFAGYERYLGNRVAERLRTVPGSAWAMGALDRILPSNLAPKNPLRYGKRFLSAATQSMASRYGQWIGFFGDGAKQRLYSAAFSARLNGERGSGWMESLFKEASELDPAEAAMAVDVHSYLPYDLLVKVDITSMANSLEARSPFLDHEVMEFAAQLPIHLKLRGRQLKFLLKKAFADLLPPEIAGRRKMGFGVPVGTWLRGEFRPLLEDSMLSNQAAGRGYFRPESIRRLLTEHVERRADHTYTLWNLLMLELWHREFID